MNIVIFSHFYDLDGVIGAVRWTSFSKRLAERGHRVYVVTNDPKRSGEIITRDNIITLYIDDECDYVKNGNKNRSKKGTSSYKKLEVGTSGNKDNIKSYIRDTIKSFLYMRSMKKAAKNNVKRIVSYFVNNNISVDYTIITSRPFIGCFNGYYFVKKMKTKWLLDQRDLPFPYTGFSIIDKIAYKLQFKKFDKLVTNYTLVSRGMANDYIELMNGTVSQKTKVLYNGYVPESLTDKSDNREEGPLKIVYVGDLYAGMRDASILFDSINLLKEKSSSFNINDIEIHYAGNDATSLFENAKKYGFESMIIDYGRVKHEKAVELQQIADIELLLTWNTDCFHGILPGKFYEYMLVKKPIVCITSGNVPHGEAGQMVENMNLGVSIEYLNYEQDVIKLSKFLELQLDSIKMNNRLVYSPDVNAVSKFNYDNLIDELMDIID